MPYHDSPSPAQRPSMIDRTSSAQSLTRASPSGALPSPTHRNSTQKLHHKAHTAGHGRLQHARNPSYGRNLNKLKAAAHAADENGAVKHHTRAKEHTPSTSPSAYDIRRNSSNVSLPRVGSKTPMKRNSSNVSLKRNGSSATQLGKLARPTTPIRNVHGKSTHRQTTNKAAQFSVGSEGQDDEWTEDSNSQSPSTTRHSSAHPGPSPQETPPPDEAPVARAQTNLPDSPPESPATTSSLEEHASSTRYPANPPSAYHSTRPPDADVVTSRLLTRHASHNLPPQVSSISVIGTPGTHTPPIYNLHDQAIIDPSMPENGVSRFLNNAGSSSGGSANTGSIAHIHTALSNLQDTPSTGSTRDRSPSPNSIGPNAAGVVRRAKSTGNLASSAPPSQADTTDSGRRSPLSYTIDPRTHRRPGGNTAAKLELWRTQVNIESPQGPPPMVVRGMPASYQASMLSTEDRRVRLWEQAEGEIGYLRRFRNPVLEGVGRAVRAVRARKNKSKRTRSTDAEGEKERGRGKESRPPSSAGRSVRFEIGGDAAAHGESDGDGEEEVEDLLRRMWLGDEGGDVYTPN